MEKTVDVSIDKKKKTPPKSKKDLPSVYQKVKSTLTKVISIDSSQAANEVKAKLIKGTNFKDMIEKKKSNTTSNININNKNDKVRNKQASKTATNNK